MALFTSPSSSNAAAVSCLKDDNPSMRIVKILQPSDYCHRTLFNRSYPSPSPRRGIICRLSWQVTGCFWPTVSQVRAVELPRSRRDGLRHKARGMSRKRIVFNLVLQREQLTCTKAWRSAQARDKAPITISPQYFQPKPNRKAIRPYE